MRRSLIAAVALIIALLPAQAFSQSSNARISGTIEDTSGAVLPGVVLTATNTGTNITTTVTSNAAGVYNFPALQPGVYRLTAELSGFQTQTKTYVQLGNAAQIRLNFTLDVRKLEQSIEVSVASDMLLLQSSSSVGSVLAEEKVSALPIISSNALDFVKVMGGAVIGMNPVWDADNSAFAGVRAANINVQRDGVTINDVRYPTGVGSPTRLNPDLIGEFRMLLSPIDAEIGRGNGQVQVMTRSGTNAYHGAGVFNIRNSALDSHSWYNNAYKVDPPFINQPEYYVSVGGPIKKNKTFFFVLWDQQQVLYKGPWTPITLTPCARKGIFRYYDNWNNGNAIQNVQYGATPTIAVVDRAGNPVAPKTNPDGSPHNGMLRYISVFQPLANTPSTPDCSDAQFQTGAATWDKYRTGMDPTGWIGSFMKMMPTANNYEVGDGLNVAGNRWTRPLHGGANLWGIGEDDERKQINVRIDHNISSGNRLSGSWSYDRRWADDSPVNWPSNSWGGKNLLNPMVLTVNFTSTLKPTLLNEFRFGMSRTGTNVYMPLDAPGSGENLKPLFPAFNGMTTLIGPGQAPAPGPAVPGIANFTIQGTSHFYGTSGLLPVGDRDTSPRWSYGDSITWTRGRHAFKGGGEIRLSSSNERIKGSWAGYDTMPYAAGGNTMTSPLTANLYPAAMAGNAANTGNRFAMASLANFLAGSLSAVREYYFLNSPTATAWSNSPTSQEQIRDFHQKELDLFFKDDWKVSDSLTLNLGLRYEYYGVPHMASGMTAALQGGSNSIFGPGLGWNNLQVPGAGDSSFRTQVMFVGPDSPNSGINAYNPDRNNFGPAVGFALQLPWLGKGKTTIRGGYQLSYIPNDRATTLAPLLGTVPGSTAMASWDGTYGTVLPYLDLSVLSQASPVPLRPGVAPLTTIPITDRSTAISIIDQNLRSPYIQNIVMAVTRNITPKVTLDVRYVGTMSRKLSGSVNVDFPNFRTNGLLDAFNAARRGDDNVALLDRMFAGLIPPGYTGASWLRNPGSGVGTTPASTSLANGDYVTLANTLNAYSRLTVVTGASKACGDPGCLLRNAGLPENFIKTSPQFGSASLYSNFGSANYNGLQAQLTLRPVHGVSLQGTYTWSRNLGYDTNAAYNGAPAGFTDPLDRRADYTLLGMHRGQTFTMYGTFDLPFGPNKLLFSSSNPVVSRIAGGWQLSWTGNISTGMPTSVTAANMLYTKGVPDRVGNFDPSAVDVVWANGAIAGNYYGGKYTKQKDPQCLNTSVVASSLTSFCTLNAIFDASSGQPVLVTPMPGKRGNFGQMNVFLPTAWNVDMSLAKSIRIAESKSISFRLDVTNVFNHVVVSGWGDIKTRRTTQRVDTAGPPDVTLTSGDPFGYLPAKVGTRQFQGKARFDF